jgi:hypothetical protein
MESTARYSYVEEDEGRVVMDKPALMSTTSGPVTVRGEPTRTGPRTARGTLRLMIVAGLLALGSFAGFGLGRMTIGDGATVAPAQPFTEVVHPGSGHVPRHWVDASRHPASHG